MVDVLEGTSVVALITAGVEMLAGLVWVGVVALGCEGDNVGIVVLCLVVVFCVGGTVALVTIVAIDVAGNVDTDVALEQLPARYIKNSENKYTQHVHFYKCI